MSEEELSRKDSIDLGYLIEAYRNLNIGNRFFTSFFEKLIGTDRVRRMILEGKSATEIRASWQTEVEKFKQQRRKYLLYEDAAGKAIK